MVSISHEPARPRARRQPFVAICSPDELLGQIISALCPRYHIDAPHLLSLRQVISSAIVAPRKPPTLKRTRPDKRIGEIGSIYDNPRRSRYGSNGPPASAEQSFYFHHQDPDFERLLPQVDRSSYKWPDEPVSQSSSEDEAVPDTQASLESMVLNTSAALATQRNILSQATKPRASRSADRTKESKLRTARQPRGSHNGGFSDPASRTDLLVVSEVSQAAGSVYPEERPHQPIPTIVVTSPESRLNDATSSHGDTVIPFSPLRQNHVTLGSPDTQDKGISKVFKPSCHSASPIVPYTDTQDTFNSTQQSEVFSSPENFAHFTPPSQEETQDMAMSQAVATMVSEAEAKETEPNLLRRSLRRSLSSSMQSIPSEPTLGKRSESEAEVAADDRPETKRLKSAK